MSKKKPDRPPHERKKGAKKFRKRQRPQSDKDKPGHMDGKPVTRRRGKKQTGED